MILSVTRIPVVITIDGPSGSGKGTISQLLAKKLGYHLLDSGALYRLVALSAQNQNINFQDERLIEDVAKNLDVKFDVEFEKVKILLAGQDVSDDIRTEVVGMNASLIAAYSLVRSALLERQIKFAQLPGLIADGRDMGTAVFPTAQIKIYLTASAEARAERRFNQLKQKGVSVNMADIVCDIKERDERDMNREISPLKPATDAILIDSTSLTIDEVLSIIQTKIATCINNDL